jgi:hypothetical protein
MNRPAAMSTKIRKPEYVSQRLREIGFWFVDIPRTSSTTLRLTFYRRYGKLFGRPSTSQGVGMGLIPPHLPASQLKEQLGAELWDSLYKFTIIRNPFERVLSLYLFLRSNGKLQQLSFPEYVRKLVSKEGYDYHGHYMSNSEYICDSDGNLLVDEVFRFENRKQAMPVIAKRTSCPEVATGKRKAYQTGHRHYSHYYDSTTRKRIEEFFLDDFDRFAYCFERS